MASIKIKNWLAALWIALLSLGAVNASAATPEEIAGATEAAMSILDEDELDSDGDGSLAETE